MADAIATCFSCLGSGKSPRVEADQSTATVFVLCPWCREIGPEIPAATTNAFELAVAGWNKQQELAADEAFQRDASV